MADKLDLIVTPKEYELGMIDGGSVGVRIRTDEIEALLPALDLVLRFQPSEARVLADGLRRWADKAEAGLSPDLGRPN